MSISKLSVRFSFLVTALLCFGSDALAQPFLRVGKNDAYATIREQSGYVNWFTTVGDTRLSFDSKSFVSFRIKNKIFTNNDAPPTGTFPLPYATLSRRGPQPGVRDTVTATWKNVDGVDIMQDVWAIGVAEDAGFPKAQLGVRYRFKNNTGGSVEIATQFLLDVQIGGEDGAKTLTKHGYRRSWASYGRGEIKELPPFFINFQNDLPNAPSFDPGLSGQGYFSKPEWGIKSPYRVTIGHWPTLERIAWGPPPPPLPTEFITDNAILMEWDPVTVLPGDSTRGPSFTYGTGDYDICIGKLMAIIFYPRRLNIDPVTTNYTPNPFDVDVYLFNPEKVQVAQNVKMKLEVGPNLTLVNVPAPSKEEEVTPDPAFINAEEVTFHSWKVQAEKHKNCSEPLETWVKLTAISSLGVPHLGYGDGNECMPKIILPCTEQDLDAPRTSNDKGTDDDSVRSFDVDDNRVKDSGLRKIDFVATAGDINNFEVTIAPFTDCSKDLVSISIKQKDSTKAGCIDFTFTDCVGNTSKKEICFIADIVPEEIDSLSPVFTLIERLGSDNGSDCNSLIDSLQVTETRDGDKGLESLTLTPGFPPVNMVLVSQPITNTSVHRFSLRAIDRFQDGQISVRATDVSGNFADTVYTYCTIKDTLAPLVNITQVGKYSWRVTVEEPRHWDRLIDKIEITSINNVRGVPALPIPTADTRGKVSYTFDIQIIDTSVAAGWCIQAFDLAGNKSVLRCVDAPPPLDVWPPSIAITPGQAFNPWKVMVNVNDIHYVDNDTSKGPVTTDTGIKEIWYSASNGITVGLPATTFPSALMQVPFYEIWATDTNNPLVTNPCVTIHARDSAGNTSFLRYCYDVNEDDMPPIIRGVAAQDDRLDLFVRDDQDLDRGLRRIELLNFDNFVPMDPVMLAGDKTLDVRLSLQDDSKSAVGRLQALDMWGANSESPDIKDRHTAWVDVAIWIQPFQMKKSYLIERTGEFVIPVHTIKNDTFSLDRKGIRSLKFAFDITGDPEVSFVRAETDGTMTAGWTITPTLTNNNRTVSLEAVAPEGSVLTGHDTNAVIRLVFFGAESELTKSAEIKIIQPNGRFVEINNSKQDTVLGPNSNAILPAPQATVNGFSVVVAGTCAPLVQMGNANTSSIAMYPIMPNPVSGSGRVQFEVGKDGPVSLRLFSSVGESVMSMVEGHITRGAYEQAFDVTGLASGSYYLRLESQGKVITKVVKIAR